MFKVKNNIAPEIMKELFAPKVSSYELRDNNSFKRRRVNCLAWHWQHLSYLGLKIWDLVPNEIKESESLSGFKFKIERWVPEGWMSMHNMRNISCASRVYNNIKNWLFSEMKLYVITIIIAYKCSVISD